MRSFPFPPLSVLPIEKIETQNVQDSESAMKIDFIKAVLRYEGKNKDGLEEVTITPHYFLERTVKGVESSETTKEVNGKTYKIATYKGVSPAQLNDIGFVFGGRNLQQDKIDEILAKIVKQVSERESCCSCLRPLSD